MFGPQLYFILWVACSLFCLVALSRLFPIASRVKRIVQLLEQEARERSVGRP